MATREVVQAGGCQQVTVAPEQSRRLGVAQAHVEPENVTLRSAHLLPQVCREARRRIADPPERDQVLLWVELQTAFVDATVEMDG